jgi:type III pantothenate kinase
LILAIDIGNSFTHLGLYESDKIVFNLNFPTQQALPKPVLKKLSRSINNKNFSAGIASVVTGESKKWKKLIKEHFGVHPIEISKDISLPIKLKIKRPVRLGADRICNSAAAYEYFKRKENVIAVDFGTATTYDVVLSSAEYIGGIISPGIETMAKSLNEHTSKLPSLKRKDLTFPLKVVGNNTIDAIRSGVVYSALDSFEGMIKKIENEYKKKFMVVLTGGFSALIHNKTALKTVIRKNLVLDGISLIVQYNERN